MLVASFMLGAPKDAAEKLEEFILILEENCVSGRHVFRTPAGLRVVGPKLDNERTMR